MATTTDNAHAKTMPKRPRKATKLIAEIDALYMELTEKAAKIKKFMRREIARIEARALELGIPL